MPRRRRAPTWWLDSARGSRGRPGSGRASRCSASGLRAKLHATLRFEWLTIAKYTARSSPGWSSTNGRLRRKMSTRSMSSIFTTSAPIAPSSAPARGTASTWPTSATRNPSRPPGSTGTASFSMPRGTAGRRTGAGVRRSSGSPARREHANCADSRRSPGPYIAVVGTPAAWSVASHSAFARVRVSSVISASISSECSMRSAGSGNCSRHSGRPNASVSPRHWWSSSAEMRSRPSRQG